MSNIKLFQEKRVRSAWNENEEQWYFSIVDVVEVLTDSPTPRQYWGKIKEREFIKLKLSPIWVQLKMLARDGKYYQTDCANTQQLLRIIQSIPSPKAEPFKRWLAQVGAERFEEIQNPELATQRTRELYKLKGYPDDWIEKRMRSIAIREELTDEWKQHGVKEQREYAILTAEISQATFGMKPSEYKEHKGLTKKNQNLRDHFTDLELIFSMLGEASTKEIVRTTHPIGFSKNVIAAKKGGKIAGDARKKLEIETGKSIVSETNYLPENEQNNQITE